MISSSRMTVVFPAPFFPSSFFPVPAASGGITTIRGRTDGTWTMAKSERFSSLSFFFFFSSTRIRGFTSFFLRMRAAMFRVLFRTSGKGREESTAMGVRTG